ncbi:ABC transporter permease [Petroclostridium xylanilyticum]|uniref:ABC transporter permease n=1 Tax=Petroclostridium xylanilyticum TaxID=1792311 RepID=UPI000B982A51|nr:ABC transporter permease [Petroclostridium xylanilyticum]
MFKSILCTIAKEWNTAVKEKMILIVLIVIPLLVNILLGYEFSGDQIQHIPMAVMDQDNSSLSRMIVQQFSESEIFNVQYYVDTSMELKNLLDDSMVRVGMIIPKGFGKDVIELRSPTILMLYDGSHMSIVSAAKTRASEILLTLKTGILIRILQGKLNLHSDMAQKMALAISFNNRILYNPAKSFKNFLTPGFGAAIVQTAIALMTAVAVKNHELEQNLRKRLGYVLGKIIFYSGLGFLSLTINIYIQNKVFNIPFRGKISHALVLSFVFALSVAAFGIMVSTWIRNEMVATAINAVIFIPSTIMAGYTWPVLSMPQPYQLAATFLPFYHYGDNVRDLFLKGIPLENMMQDIAWLSQFTAAALFASILGILRLKAVETKTASMTVEEGEPVVFS